MSRAQGLVVRKVTVTVELPVHLAARPGEYLRALTLAVDNVLINALENVQVLLQDVNSNLMSSIDVSSDILGERGLLQDPWRTGDPDE